jgi:hypothetical protein
LLLNSGLGLTEFFVLIFSELGVSLFEALTGQSGLKLEKPETIVARTDWDRG